MIRELQVRDIWEKLLVATPYGGYSKVIEKRPKRTRMGDIYAYDILFLNGLQVSGSPTSTLSCIVPESRDVKDLRLRFANRQLFCKPIVL